MFNTKCIVSLYLSMLVCLSIWSVDNKLALVTTYPKTVLLVDCWCYKTILVIKMGSELCDLYRDVNYIGKDKLM